LPILDRFKKAWNAFVNPINEWTAIGADSTVYYGGGSPSRQRLIFYSERSIISSIYTRISIDVSSLDIRHVKLDDQNRYLSDSESALNDCLMLEANLDQSPRAFRQDIVMSLFDKGCAAIVPVDTSRNPQTNEIFDIYTLRVGEIINWYPRHVRVSVYNENKGKREEITLEKRYVAIVENPLYSVMNEPNSTLQRLIRKLSLLDTVDEQSSSGKLDLIIQLPYVIKSETRRQQAEKRRTDIEFQLKGSQYGIAYTDGTEKITQLNRPAENNLLKQVEYLTNMLYSQLGITEEVMNGTADEKAMLNYFNRTIEPIIDAIVEAMQRSFLGRRAKSNDERIKYFQDPFKLVPVAEIAEIADKFTRNEILTANEIRQFMGIPPATDPKADQLVNSNMPQPTEPVVDTTEQDAVMDEALSALEGELDSILGDFGAA
jgi:Phage portal protein